jgi:tetratricopeptide (TPR) repeat protein
MAAASEIAGAATAEPGAHQQRVQLQAELNLAYGQMLVYSGQPEAGETVAQRALRTFRDGHDRRGEAAALSVLGEAELWTDHYAEAQSSLEQSLAIAREIGDRRGEGEALSLLGIVARSLGQYEAANGYLEQALAINREIGNRRGEGADLSLLGQVALRRGQYEAANGYLEQSLAIHQEVGDRRWEARSLATLGGMAEAQNDLARAETLYRQSLALATEQGLGPQIAEVELALGRLLNERLNRPEEGCPLVLEAARRYAEMGMPDEEVAWEAARLGCPGGSA